jgi:hypothetical protein
MMKIKKQIIDPTENTIFIFDLQTSNNCNNVKFGMQKFTDDMSRVVAKSTIVLFRSSGVFAQS